MQFDITNFASGLAGAVIGALASLGTSYLKFRWQRAENEKQRQHEWQLQSKKERHDKDMQRREANHKRSGIHDMREIGMG